MKKIVSLVLALALIITTVNIGALNVYAGTDTYFAYRVDVVDAKAATSSRITLDVAANTNGKVYAYATGAGSEAPAVADIKKKGNATEITANKETAASVYCYYNYSYVKVGNSYDIYICFEDSNGKTYGPYVEK